MKLDARFEMRISEKERKALYELSEKRNLTNAECVRDMLNIQRESSTLGVLSKSITPTIPICLVVGYSRKPRSYHYENIQKMSDNFNEYEVKGMKIIKQLTPWDPIHNLDTLSIFIHPSKEKEDKNNEV